MHETEFSYANLEHPCATASLVPGPHELRGWIIPKAGHHFTDLRVRCGASIVPAVLGYPRPDLAEYVRHGLPILAGFQATVYLTHDANHICVEALTIEGIWVPCLKVSFEIPSHPIFPPPSQSTAPLQWHEYLRGFELALKHPDNTEEIAHSLIFERRILPPQSPFHGFWDEPAAFTPIKHGRLAAGGYLLHETAPIRRVLATTDLLLWQTMDYGRDRPDVAAHFPEIPHAASCGFFGLVDAPSQLPSPLSMRIFAELPDGTLHLCGTQRTRAIASTSPPNGVSIGALTLTEMRGYWESCLSRHNLQWSEHQELTTALAKLTTSPRFKRTSPKPTKKTHRPFRNRSHPQKITLCTHNLNLEGAPFFLLDLSRALIGAGAHLTLISPCDGPIKLRFIELGVKVLIQPLALMSGDSSSPIKTRLDTLASLTAFEDTELVIANTFAAFWGIQAAALSQKPTLFYIHESVTPADFFQDQLSAETIALIEDSFSLADCVSFTTAATRDCHLSYTPPENSCITPGWIDIESLHVWQSSHPRAQSRALFELGEEDWLVSNIGTVSDRKGQHVFVRAVELLWRNHPELAARTQFVMLGGRDTVFDHLLQDLLKHANRHNLRIVEETTDYLPYFQAADLFVCSSYEESSPRVILEAMALGTPILSTNVDGVPEQVRHGIDAELVPPGDCAAMEAGIFKLLTQPKVRQSHAVSARQRVQDHFSAEQLLPRHVALASSVADR